MNAELRPSSLQLVAQLEALLGKEHVLTDATERTFYSTDIYHAGELPLAVVRPATTAERDIGSDLNLLINPFCTSSAKPDAVNVAPKTTVCVKIPAMRNSR